MKKSDIRNNIRKKICPSRYVRISNPNIFELWISAFDPIRFELRIFEVLLIHRIILGVPTSKYGWIGNGSMFTVDWIVCSLQSAADKKGPSRQKRAQRLLLKVIFFSFWKLSPNIWSHHKPEKLTGFNSIQFSMMKSFYGF